MLGLALALAACQRETVVAASFPQRVLETAPSRASAKTPVVEPLDLKRISLVGVTFRGTERNAFISIDNTEPAVRIIGATVLGAELISIEPEYVVLMDGGKRVTVRMVGTVTTAIAAQVPTPLSLSIQPMPGGLVSPALFGTGNTSFLDAVEKAGQRTRDRD